jgi:hypothetical protein
MCFFAKVTANNRRHSLQILLFIPQNKTTAKTANFFFPKKTFLIFAKNRRKMLLRNNNTANIQITITFSTFTSKYDQKKREKEVIIESICAHSRSWKTFIFSRCQGQQLFRSILFAQSTNKKVTFEKGQKLSNLLRCARWHVSANRSSVIVYHEFFVKTSPNPLARRHSSRDCCHFFVSLKTTNKRFSS